MTTAKSYNKIFNILDLLAVAAVAGWFYIVLAGWTLNGPPSALDTHTHNEHCSSEAQQ